MGKKRFIIDDDGIVTDMVDLSMCIDNEDCCEKLNELDNENKKLKAKVDDKEVAVEVECEKLMQKVFEVIDKSLEKDKQDYEMTYEDYLNGRIEALEELKKELIMND